MRTRFACLIGIISLLLGYFLRDAVTPSAENHDPFPTHIESSARQLTLGSHRRSLERAMRLSKSTQRWLQIVALLEKAKLNNMEGIAKLIDSSDSQVVTLVAQRWFELDPEHFFKTCLLEKMRILQGEPKNFACSEFLYFLAREWPQLHFENAFEAFSRPESEIYLEDARDQFVNEWARIDPNKAIELRKAWGTGLWSNGISYLKSATRNDPQSIAETIFVCYPTNSSPNGSSYPDGANLLAILAAVWGEASPLEALAFANSHESDQAQFLQSKIIETWFDHDSTSANQWLQDQDDETQEKYRYLIDKVKVADGP